MWVQHHHPGCDLITACLEPLPTSLSSHLTPSSTLSTYVAGTQLKAALSSYLHHSLSPTSFRVHSLNSFAPPYLPSLCDAVLTYIAALSSPFSSCSTVISALSAFSPMLPPAIIGVAANRWIKRSVLELNSSEETTRRAAGKGLVLSLVLCEELHVDPDVVWDAELNEVYITQLFRYSMQLPRRTRMRRGHEGSEDGLPSMPPLVSLIAHLLSSGSLNQRWLPQLVRSTRLSSSIPWLLQSRQLMQTLTSLFPSLPASPLSVQAVVEHAAPEKEWLNRLSGWRDRVVDLQRHPQSAAPSTPSHCVCGEAEFPLVEVTSSEGDDFVTLGTTINCSVSSSAVGEAAPSDACRPISQQRFDEVDESVAAFLTSSAFRSVAPPCSHRWNGGDLSYESLQLPPFPRWLRWVVASSFVAPVPAERCYAFILDHYSPHIPLHTLLTDCFLVAVSSVQCRRRAGVCPFLTPDLPPLMDRLLCAAAHRETTESLPPSHWLLRAMVALLSGPTISVNSVEDVLRAVPRLQEAALPSTGAVSSALLQRLFRLRRTTDFLMAWLLQSCALYWKRSSQSSRTSLVQLIRDNTSELGRSLSPESVHSALLDTDVSFKQHVLALWNDADLPLDMAPQSPLDAMNAQVECPDASTEEVHQEDHRDIDSLSRLVSGVDVQWFEVDWSRVCDDDSNLALLQKVERDKKTGKRLHTHSTPLSVEQHQSEHSDAPPDPHSSHPLAAVNQREAQTQTTAPHVPAMNPSSPMEGRAATSDTATDDVGLALDILLPSFISTRPGPVPSVATDSSALVAGDDVDVLDLFTLPESLLESPLDGFVISHPMERPPSTLRRPSSPPPPPARLRPPSMLPPTARAVTFTPIPRQHPPPASPSSPPRSLSRLPLSPSPLILASPASDSGGFSHLRSASITVKRSMASLVPPPVVDVAAQMELQSRHHHHNPLYNHLTRQDPLPPWMKDKALQWVDEDETGKRRRMV